MPIIGCCRDSLIQGHVIADTFRLHLAPGGHEVDNLLRQLFCAIGQTAKKIVIEGIFTCVQALQRPRMHLQHTGSSRVIAGQRGSRNREEGLTKGFATTCSTLPSLCATKCLNSSCITISLGDLGSGTAFAATAAAILA